MSEINWKSKFTFGKYKDLELLTVWIKDKNYIKWCIENELHLSRPEIAFILNEINESEKRQLKLNI